MVKNEAVPALQDIMKEEMQQFKKIMEENDKKQKEKQEQQLQELKDDEVQKNNIIIFGVPESKVKEGTKRREDDHKFVVELNEKNGN